MDKHRATIIEVIFLALIILIWIAGVLAYTSLKAESVAAPTWTPRPTGAPVTPTYEVFLPIIQDGEPTATPIPRPTTGVP